MPTIFTELLRATINQTHELGQVQKITIKDKNYTPEE